MIRSYIEKASRTKQETVQESKPSILVNTLPISLKLIKNIVSRGYEYLMPIQEKAIPAILDGKDVIGIANTGTGKTAAFLIPIIEKIIKNPSYKALIITPTRELALR